MDPSIENILDKKLSEYDPMTHAMLSQIKDQFQKLKFGLVELESKREFLDSMGRSTETNKSEAQTSLPKLKEVETEFNELLSKLDTNLTDLVANISIARTKEASKEKLTVEIENMKQELVKLKEKESVDVEYTLKELEEQYRKQQENIEELKGISDQLTEKSKQLSQNTVNIKQKKEVLMLTRDNQKEAAERRIKEKTLEERTELLNVKNWMVNAVKVVENISSLKLSVTGEHSFTVTRENSDEVIEFVLKDDCLVEVKIENKEVKNIKTIRELRNRLYQI
eukprot:GHVP01068762.1.p1 GENE.GHVP01068762.1~~GHVP01068762.1.p1  ORF type:complete len:281 (-),score=68.18 GHVP01068762.1:774-1616(-)